MTTERVIEERMILRCWKGILLECGLQGDGVHRSGYYVAGIRPVMKVLGLEVLMFADEKLGIRSCRC